MTEQRAFSSSLLRSLAGPREGGTRLDYRRVGSTAVRSRAVSVVAGLVALASGGGGLAGLRVALPRDHYAHPAARIEWWYVTGVVRGRDGRRYSVFFTLFRRAGLVLPISQV